MARHLLSNSIWLLQNPCGWITQHPGLPWIWIFYSRDLFSQLSFSNPRTWSQPCLSLQTLDFKDLTLNKAPLLPAHPEVLICWEHPSTMTPLSHQASQPLTSSLSSLPHLPTTTPLCPPPQLLQPSVCTLLSRGWKLLLPSLSGNDNALIMPDAITTWAVH